MSNSPSTLPRERLVELREMLNEQHVNTGLKVVTAPFRFVGFWAAVALPFLYLPLLFNGLNQSEITVFTALVALNALALIVGHNYARS
ncbi:hypothetical protein ACFQJC_02565 [Haloferax namakaokahaiae]|uniref:Acyl-CoA desaturase n=1 Tax=Haloferax namakaokahaiae TaxID=1748331 RepID=A0ABD5ZB42_9EURY